MLFGRNHPRDRERREQFCLVLDALDFEPDHGELVGEPLDGLVGVEMLLQPGESEFHGCFFSTGTVRSLPRLRGRVGVGALSAMTVAIASTTPARLVITS